MIDYMINPYFLVNILWMFTLVIITLIVIVIGGRKWVILNPQS